VDDLLIISFLLEFKIKYYNIIVNKYASTHLYKNKVYKEHKASEAQKLRTW